MGFQTVLLQKKAAMIRAWRMAVDLLQKHKIMKGFLLVFVFFSLIVVLTYKTYDSLIATSEGSKRAVVMLSTLESLRAGLEDVESAVKVGSASEPDSRPVSYLASEKKVNDALSALHRLVRDNAEQQERFAKLQSLTAQRMEAARRIVNADPQEGPVKTFELPEAEPAGAPLVAEEIQRMIHEMSDLQKQQLQRQDTAKNAGVWGTRYLVVFGSLIGMIVVMLSIVLARRELAQRRKAEETVKMLSTSVDQATDLVMVTNAEGVIEYVNRAIEETTGYPVAKLIGNSWDVLKPENGGGVFLAEAQETLRSGRSFQADVVRRTKNGELVTLHETVTPIMKKGGDIAHLVFTGKDMTHQKSLEVKVDRLTNFDTLTGLLKRDLFVDRLGLEIERAQKDAGMIAVFLMNIDRFKLMNDVFGIEAADEILRVIAKRLLNSLNESASTARIGSDEFGAIVKNLSTAADVIPAADKILKDVSRPITVQKKEIFVTLGVGIALYPSNGEDTQTLMKNADVALSQAKYQGRNSYQFYSKDMSIKASEQLDLENDLFTALSNHEYLVNYQPYHELTTKNIAGAEALIKWKHAGLGIVSPVDFIPALEKTGMIIDVGEWVLRTACQQLKEWDTRRSFFPVSVNLSGNQFRHKYLVNMVDRAIKDFSLDPSHLTLEITEGTFMNDLDFSCNVLKKLKKIGISISVDDFGTGYSSLSYLKKLPVDIVKIDRSFVKDVATDPDAASIVTAIVTMARSLNLKTIAEGIETEEQSKILRLLRCDMGQGFYFSPALSPQDIEKYFC